MKSGIKIHSNELRHFKFVQTWFLEKVTALQFTTYFMVLLFYDLIIKLYHIIFVIVWPDLTVSDGQFSPLLLFIYWLGV